MDAARLLQRAPAWLRQYAQHVARGEGPVGRIVDSVRFRAPGAELPQLPEADAPIRLLIAPANSAGQGFQWARSAEAFLDGVSAVALQATDSGVFAPDVDVRVAPAVFRNSRRWFSAFEEFATTRSHILWESGYALLPRASGGVVREVRRLEERGVRAGLLFHGSDIRPPAQHALVSRWSPFSGAPGLSVMLEDGARRNARLIAKLGVPVFVSTPDLLRWVPDAVWLPVVVDLERWSNGEARQVRSRPVVVHAPSQAWLKGSDVVEPVLRSLDAEGVIEYRRLAGVPHSAMPEFYMNADVVLDQFVLGIYGVAACEAMAAGKLVMSHVDEFTREQVRERTGRDLPIYESTIDTLESDLRRYAADPDQFDDLRAQGPEFVADVHSGKRSAAALAPFLGLSERMRKPREA